MGISPKDRLGILLLYKVKISKQPNDRWGNPQRTMWRCAVLCHGPMWPLGILAVMNKKWEYAQNSQFENILAFRMNKGQSTRDKLLISDNIFKPENPVMRIFSRPRIYSKWPDITWYDLDIEYIVIFGMNKVIKCRENPQVHTHSVSTKIRSSQCDYILLLTILSCLIDSSEHSM